VTIGKVAEEEEKDGEKEEERNDRRGRTAGTRMAGRVSQR